MMEKSFKNSESKNTNILNIEQLSVKFTEKISSTILRLKEKLGESDLGKRIFKKVCRKLWTLTKWTTAIGIISGVYTGTDLDNQEGFTYREKAAEQLRNEGIPNDQKYSAYKPGISEMLYEGIMPLGYQDDADKNLFMGSFFEYLKEKGVPNTGMLQDFFPNVVKGRKERAGDIRKYNESVNSNPKLNIKERIEKRVSKNNLLPSELPSLDDAWRIYLGLAQNNNTFGISDFKPAKGREDKYYFKLNNFWEDFFNGGVSLDWNQYNISSRTPDSIKDAFSSNVISRNDIRPDVEVIKKLGGAKSSIIVETEYLAVEGGDVMYHFTIALGEDEKGSYIAYYDKWDLASFFSENIITKGVGKPFEIYDRIYYNPKTGEVYGYDKNSGLLLSK